MRLILVEQADLDQAVADLAGLRPQARTLLGRCIEHQGVTRRSCSPAALELEAAGFIRMRQHDDGVELLPTLAGEEAMAAAESPAGC